MPDMTSDELQVLAYGKCPAADVRDARIEALERELNHLHAALTVFEAGWDNYGLLDPGKFWSEWWPYVDRNVPAEHQSLLWAAEQVERECAYEYRSSGAEGPSA